MITNKAMESSLKELTETLYKFEHGQASLEEVFVKIVEIFRSYSVLVATLSEEKKEEWSKQCKDHLQQLVAILEPFIHTTATTDEQLVQALSERRYFNAIEWEHAQKAKDEIMQSLNVLRPLFGSSAPLEKEIDSTPDATRRTSHKHPSKSDWMKS